VIQLPAGGCGVVETIISGSASPWSPRSRIALRPTVSCRAPATGDEPAYRAKECRCSGPLVSSCETTSPILLRGTNAAEHLELRDYATTIVVDARDGDDTVHASSNSLRSDPARWIATGSGDDAVYAEFLAAPHFVDGGPGRDGLESVFAEASVALYGGDDGDVLTILHSTAPLFVSGGSGADAIRSQFDRSAATIHAGDGNDRVNVYSNARHDVPRVLGGRGDDELSCGNEFGAGPIDCSVNGGPGSDRCLEIFASQNVERDCEG
jgi:hypothetical protein